MTERLAEQAGTAVVWKTVQLGGSQTISLIRLLILARLLVPDDFGLLAIAMITIQTMVLVTDFGMIPGLVQYNDPKEIHYNTAWTVGITRGLVVTIVGVVAAPWIAELFKEPRATPIIRILAFRPLIDAAASIKIAELTRRFQFRPLAFINLSGILIEAIVSVGLAVSMGVWALVTGSLAGGIAYLVVSYILSPHTPRFCFNRDAALPIIRYGRWIFIGGLVGVSGSAVLNIVISRNLGVVNLGIYYLASKLTALPGSIASKVIGEVALSLYARMQSDIQKCVHTFQAILTGMVALLFPVYALMIALAPALVRDILGSKWEGSAPVIRILSVAALIGFFGDTVTPLLKGYGNTHKVAVLEAVQSFVIILLISWLAGNYALIGAAIAWVPANLITQVCAAIFAIQILGRPFVGLSRPVIAIAFASTAGAAAALAIDGVLSGILGLTLAVFLAITIIGALLYMLERRFKMGLANDFSIAFPQVAAKFGISSATGV